MQEGANPPSIQGLLGTDILNPDPSSLFTFYFSKRHQQLSAKEIEKSYFEMIFIEDFSHVRRSDAIANILARSTAKERLYSKKVAIQAKTVYYKIRVFIEKWINKSVFVPGYGNLIHDFVQCRIKEK